jgi:hypothetical protein
MASLEKIPSVVEDEAIEVEKEVVVEEVFTE